MRVLRFILLLLILGSAAAAAFYGWATHPLSVPATGVEVTIVPGSSIRTIGEVVGNAGVGAPAPLFNLLARLTGNATRLKAGTYAIVAGLTPAALLDRMERGEVVQIELVIVEGWTFRQMRQAIAADADLKQLAPTLSDAALLSALGATEANPEGLFFPDTYRFSRGTTDLDVYRRAYKAMQKRLAEAWSTRAADLPLKSPYEALILASLVEKETGRAEDRAMVAAVFVNRLNRAMPLQTDPSVIYGMGAHYGGALHKHDLSDDTVYNTYTRSGLPPSPIALPGAASLAAAVNPARSDALYFVSRGDGTSVFSQNLDDHNRAVNQYQRGGH